MAIVGAYARIEINEQQVVRHRLDSLEGVATFDLDDPATLGLVIEAQDLDAAHDAVCDVIAATEGVLGVWPVFVHTEEARSEDGASPRKESTDGILSS